MSALIPFAWDTETYLIEQNTLAPRLVCLSWATPHSPAGVADRESSYNILKKNLARDDILWIAHNAAYDFGVAAANFPDLLPDIFKAYESNRVTDTNIREKLARIARGTHFKARDYNLADLSQQYIGKDRHEQKKAPDAWRLRYSELDGVPLAQWPDEAKDYAIEDSADALEVWRLQEEQDFTHQFLEDQYRQARKSFWLHLMSAWGITTNPQRVQALDDRVRTRYEELKAHLQEDGLVRRKETKKRLDDPKGNWKAGDTLTTYHRNEKLARKLMWDVCEWQGVKPTPTDAAKVRMREARKAKESYVPTPEDCALSAEACEKVAHPEGDLCNQPTCPVCILTRYGEFSNLSTYISTDLPILWEGTRGAIHTNFDGLKETGRTGASKPNLQNQKRSGGVRECYVPRPGYVFIDCDYDGLELRTMAQVCKTVFGYSALADALNAGDDPHLRVAASILKIPYEKAKALREAQDPGVEDARQTGKIATFGFPGGLGALSLVDYAWSNYRIRMNEHDARELKAVWINTFPEFQRYFEWINSHIGPGGKGSFKHLFSNRTRGDAIFTQLCNTPFQGLGADATGRAGWLIAKACYLDTSSPLYGSRPVNYIHDQFILETPDTPNAPLAAAELSRIMCEGANEFLPDVPATATAILCRRWSKSAKPVFNEAGTLIPWEQAA